MLKYFKKCYFQSCF